MKNRIGLVTGGTKGIGLAVAKAMIDSGMKVAISSRDAGNVLAATETLGGGENVFSVICDVRDPIGCEAMVDQVADHFGGLDVLINNAGVGRFGSIQDLSLEDWQVQVDTNLSGVFYCSKAAIPHLKGGEGGWIVNLGSLASRNAFAGGSAYNASKFGLLGLTEAMMLDLRYENIRVSIVMPGSVNTHFFGHEPGEEWAWRLQAEDIARGVMDLLAYPPRATPSKIELRPSQPPRG